ncbi:MAG: DinB family protein, partial [Candidatus Thiodiazotropha lotti]
MDSAIARQTDREQLIEEFRRVRKYTETLCAPLSVDDYQIQSIAQTSPPKWHIAHVTWFFEAFVLLDFDDHYECFDGRYDYLFNSYYYTHGKMHPRPDRGLLSRPTVEQIYRYRHSVDLAMERLMSDISASRWEALAFRVTLGLNHEQQHQELLLMDIKHNFSVNPLKPAYRDDLSETTKPG